MQLSSNPSNPTWAVMCDPSPSEVVPEAPHGAHESEQTVRRPNSTPEWLEACSGFDCVGVSARGTGALFDGKHVVKRATDGEALRLPSLLSDLAGHSPHQLSLPLMRCEPEAR